MRIAVSSRRCSTLIDCPHTCRTSSHARRAQYQGPSDRHIPPAYPDDRVHCRQRLYPVKDTPSCPPSGHLTELCRNPGLVYRSSRFLQVTRRAEYVMENENVANLDLFSELVPSTIEIEGYVSIDNNILTEDNALIISDIINCNLDNFSEKETSKQLEEQKEEEEEEEDDSIYNPTLEEVWKTINNLKTYFKNNKDEIALSMVANLQIHCEDKKKFTQKKITDFF
ncbi:hypothetical protein QTP88_026030 [Uroleucon formosanum]